MLQLILVLSALHLVTGNPECDNRPTWTSKKEECKQFLSTNNIKNEDLKKKTYKTNCNKICAKDPELDYTTGINCFALLNDEQMAQFSTNFDTSVGDPDIGTSDGGNDVENRPLLPGEEIPDEYNHATMGSMTDARNQGGCGSCWAFSAMSQLENTYIKYTGEHPDQVDFSEQQMVDCTFESSGTYDACDGGWMSQAWQRLRDYEKNKLCSEEQYPYVAEDEICDANVTWRDNAFSRLQLKDNPTDYGKVYRWYSDSSSTTKTDNSGYSYQVVAEDSARFIYHNYSISVALMAEDDFFSYRSGIFNTHSVDNSINHAVTMFGYTQEYFDIQNSWGLTTWGDNGCAKITRRSGNIIQMFSYMMFPYVQCTYGVNTAGYCRASETDEGCMCHNGGHCKSDSSGSEVTYCVCQPGWSGDLCTEEGEAECDCMNGGECMYDVKTCADVVNEGSCRAWASLGYCYHSYVGYMTENCAKSCGVCDDSCYVEGEAYKYRGNMSVTEEGKWCQSWSEQYPHNHDFNSWDFEEYYYYGLDDGNFCRDPDNTGQPWCYTNENETRWQVCDVPHCQEMCNCTEGWTGDKCQVPTDLCYECEHGDCDPDIGDCVCHDGWEGENCDRDEDEGTCGCKNGGQCNTHGGCDCKEGFSGDKCEIVDCECENNGTCNAAGECECPDGFTGDKCEERACDKKCKNGKVCYWKTEDKMKCRCPDGSYGKGCTEQADCTLEEKKTCQKKKNKDEEKFWSKCKKNWGPKKCPHSCGFCDDK